MVPLVTQAMPTADACASPLAVAALVLLAAVTLGVNAVSTMHAVRRVRGMAAEAPSARSDALLLLARSAALLVLAAVAAALWQQPAWLVAAASLTALVQAMDLAIGGALRLGWLQRAAAAGLAAQLVALAALALSGACLG